EGVHQGMCYLRIDARLDPLDHVGHPAQQVLARFRASLGSFPIWLNDGAVGEPPNSWSLGLLVMAHDKSSCLLTRALADPLVHRLLPFFAAAGDRLTIILAGVPVALSDEEARFAITDFELGTQPASMS